MEQNHFANGAYSAAVSALDSVCSALSCNDSSLFVCGKSLCRCREGLAVRAVLVYAWKQIVCMHVCIC